MSQLVLASANRPSPAWQTPSRRRASGIKRVVTEQFLQRARGDLVLPLCERLPRGHQERSQIATGLGLHAGAPRVVQHDDADVSQSVDRAGHLELRAPQRVREGAQVALPVHGGQDLPLERNQIQLLTALLIGSGQPGDQTEVGDLGPDAGPLVESPGRLHEQRLGRKPHRRLDRRLAGRTFLEAEIPFGPSEQLEHRLLDLCLQLAVQLAPGDSAERDENVAEATPVARRLYSPGSIERFASDLSRPHQAAADGM